MKARQPDRFRRAVALLLAAVVACPALWPAGARATEDASLEQRVKAAYLYQFAGYVEWPPRTFAQADTPITIAVLGNDGIEEELRAVASGRRIAGRAIAVRRFAAGDPLEGVHVLFIARSESGRLEELARLARSNAVLAVTEWDGAIEKGAMINFIMVDRRVRFEVGLSSAEQGGLRVSSRLLAVAEHVRTEGF